MKHLWNTITDWFTHNWNKSHAKLTYEAATGMPYDWTYLLTLEREKIREMRDYFVISDVVDHTHNIKWMNICIKLLDIIIDDDGQFDTQKMNFNNIDRFIRKPIKDGVIWDEVVEFYKKYPADYRFVKAWYLYFEIRKNYTGNWWD
jgi:hypothetical protein